MSKFIDNLKDLTKASPKPMGFITSRSTAKKPKIQLIANLTEINGNGFAEAIAPADAVMVKAGSLKFNKTALKKITGQAGKKSWGMWIEGSTPDNALLAIDNGCDFLVITASDSLHSVPKSDNAGTILKIDDSIKEGLLRTINVLSIDAVLIDFEQAPATPMTWSQLMTVQYFTALITKPLLLAVSPAITGDELQMLWEAGIDGIVIDTTESNTELTALRKVIDAATFPLPRKKRETVALLPHVESAQEPITEPFEPEEPDDE